MATNGAPSMAAAQQFQNEAQRVKTMPGLIQNPIFFQTGNEVLDRARTLAINANNFPSVPLPADPYDTQWKIKQDMTDTNVRGDLVAPISASRPLAMTKEDVDYLKRKQSYEETSTFKAWVKNRIDMKNPAEVFWAQQKCPFLFEDELQLLEKKLDDAARYAKIKLLTPQSEEDWKFVYWVENGLIQLPKGPVYDPFNEALIESGVSDPERASVAEMKDALIKHNRKVYQAGLFSPIAPKMIEQGNLSVNPYNKADPRGMPGSNYLGPMGTVLPTKQNYLNAYGGTARDTRLGAARFNGANVNSRQNIVNRNRELLATRNLYYNVSSGALP